MNETIYDNGTITWAIQRAREAFSQPRPLKKQDSIRSRTL